MKTNLSLLLVTIFIFCSCVPNNKYSRKWLGDIPAHHPKLPLKIVYPNEPLPKQPYVEILRMDLALPGYQNSKKLVEELKKTAIHEGVDGIIILDARDDTLAYANQRIQLEHDYFDNDPSISEGYIHGDFYEMISGIGIKFLDNMDYITKLVKNEELFLIRDSLPAPKLLANIDYYPSGSVKDFRSIQPEAEQIYLENIKPYAKYYLFYDQKGKWHEWFYQNRLTKREKYKLGDWMIKRISIYYDHLGNRRSVTIKENENKYPSLERIYYTREKGRVTERRILRNNQPDLIEKFTYDANGIVIARDIYEMINKEEIHFFKSIYSHYSKENLKDLLNKKKVSLQSSK